MALTKTQLEEIAAERGVDISGAKNNNDREALLVQVGVLTADGTLAAGGASESTDDAADAPGDGDSPESGGDAGEPEAAAPVAVPAEGSVRVRFLERNTHPVRGTFEPGEETVVAARRAQIWAEGRVVEIVGAEA